MVRAAGAEAMVMEADAILERRLERWVGCDGRAEGASKGGREALRRSVFIEICDLPNPERHGARVGAFRRVNDSTFAPRRDARSRGTASVRLDQ